MFNITCEKRFERNENSFTIKIRNKKNKKKIFNETSKNKMKEVCKICNVSCFYFFYFQKRKRINKNNNIFLDSEVKLILSF